MPTLPALGRSGLALATAILLALPAVPAAANPYQQDPAGPLRDVTDRWRRFQPARTFCVRPNVFDLSPTSGKRVTGRHKACRRSGWPRKARNLVLLRVKVPGLCDGCRRLFLNYRQIPRNAAPYLYAHGHVYVRLVSANPGYTANPRAHSPNVRTLSNDHLLVPNGAPHQGPARAADATILTFAGNTARTANSRIQGPWYVGPWYVSQ